MPDLTYLAPYATHWTHSRGREHDEPAADDRTPFQRDRDRLIHSDAFRRLQHKTQVYTNSEEGDFRTRLTHTLEVAQLTRTICRALHLDEDLGEVCALAHDLGHPPFGHAGESALQSRMAGYGGFDHNLQTMQLVRRLESRYGHFDGLNLTWESLEGIAKHNGPLPPEWHQLALCRDLEPNSHSGLEAQVAAVCDDMAYNHHDLDDGLASGLITIDQVMVPPAFKRVWEEVSAMYPNASHHRHIKETIRRMISRQVKDVLKTTRRNLSRTKPTHVDEVRAHGKPIVNFSEEVKAENATSKAFLMEYLYHHFHKNRMAFQAHRILGDLFGAFFTHRRMLPPEAQAKLIAGDDAVKARVVCDYVACLTDRSAMREHRKLFGELIWH